MEAIQNDQNRMNYYTVHIALNFITPLGLKKFVAQSMVEYFKAKFEDRMQHQTKDGRLLNDEGYKYSSDVSKKKPAFNYGSLTANRNKKKVEEGFTYDVPDSEEFTLLYLPEFMAKSVDAGALLTVIKKSSCFDLEITQLADNVSDQVRNRTAHAVYEEWTDDRRDEALNQLIELAEAIGLDRADIALLEKYRDENVFVDNFTIKDEMESYCQFLTAISGDEDISVSSLEPVFPDCKNFIRSLLAKLTSSGKDLGFPNKPVILYKPLSVII
jgi:hypothetical protein